ncbi:prepilin-type N-terminal cleavage/methylation domain-containing protein [Neobacillus sp. D3-1R]|uniref:prepilin-type N-terminal cleavage/methylation domain-containing protein n=1 Tax=Neobacillus sp. D3-1R TaxID=3445778 RepID=UPI003FA09FA0
MVKEQKGFTLLEVLLSITILSIILISFFSFFPQAAKFNDTNDQKLKGVSLAKEVLVTIQSSNSIQSFLNNVSTNPTATDTFSKNNPQYQSLKLSEDIINHTDYYQLITKTPDAKVIIKLFKSPDFNGSKALYKTEIIVEILEGKKVTNLYGYITH